MWFWPIIELTSFIVGGFVLGWLLDRFVLRWLVGAATRTLWRSDDAVLASSQGILVLWGTLAGIGLAVSSAALDQRFADMIMLFLRVNVIVSLALVFLRIVSRVFTLYAEKHQNGAATNTLFLNLARLFIVTIALMFILQGLGVEIAPLLTTLGVGGIAVALALQDTLSNVFAGIYILLSRKMKIGDFVRLDTGDEGYITDINWRNTTVRALSNNLIILPNAKVASGVVQNYHLPQTEQAVLVDVGVSYTSDLTRVEQVTVEVATQVMQEVPGAVADFTPFIRFNKFTEYSINFTTILRGREYTDQFLLKHEFIKRLHQRYREEGIEMPVLFPQQVAA